MDRFFYHLECFLKTRISRKGFLKACLGGLAFFISQNTFLKKAFSNTADSPGRKGRGAAGLHDLVLAEGKDPYANTVKAVEKMGGMQRFVKTGDTVVVKPNMAWDRTPDQAANTDPAVVAAIVEMCYKAGAKRVNVFDITCNNERLCYVASGIAKAAREKGANVYYPDHWNVVKAEFPYESSMHGWPVLRDAVKCDAFINVPVLKDHGLTRLTLSMKNLMGVCSGKRGLIHMGIGSKLVDITDYIKPDLTVIDATRYMFENGPSGGNLADVKKLDKVIVATDPTLADTFACTLVNVDPMAVPYIKVAAERKFGSTDIAAADIVKISV